MPSAVAVPVDVHDVVALVKWAAATGTPLTPRGSGSSMAGGAIGTGVVVDLSRLNQLGRIDEKTRTVWAAPGVIRGTLDAAARKRGLRFPVDPSSGSFCTIGGMVATNAAGARSLRHGATRLWVNALDCVFNDGERAIITRGEEPPRRVDAIRRFLQDAHGPVVSSDARHEARHRGVRKEASGYGIHDYAAKADLIELLVGSEGTLAIIVGVQLRLIPVAAATSSVLGSFRSLEEATIAAGRALESGASACELLERTFLTYAAAAPGGNDALKRQLEGAEAILIAEVEGDSASSAAAGAEILATAFRAAGASAVEVALTPESEKALWELRHAASPILSTMEDFTSMQFIEDAAVPPAKLPDYIKGVRQALAARKMEGVIFGHAADGHVHVNPLVDVKQPDWRQRMQLVLDEVVMLTAKLGGTLTGEHGDGRIRAPLLRRVWHKDTLQAFAVLKTAFDPGNIFNPGVKVALPGQKSLADIKYDPSLPPLPKEARAALDEIVRSRGYDRFRLSLVGGST